MEWNDQPPELKPCPFCGQPLSVRWRKINPKAHCATPGCWGGNLPVLQLDIPEFVAAWNTRPGEDSCVMKQSDRPQDDAVTQEWFRGYRAGKARARYEVLAVVVALYFIVALIGKFSDA